MTVDVTVTGTCPVCLEREMHVTRGLCKPCLQSLARVHHGTYPAVVWAADRARRFERARQKNKERST